MRTIFTQKEVDEFNQHPCIFHCSQKYIHYTYEFKKRALELYTQGVNPKEIWRQAGFNTERFHKNYTYSTLKDWRVLVKKKGVEGLENLGGVKYDRGVSYKKESVEVDLDKIKRLELQVKYLQAENDFLAKLRTKKSGVKLRSKEKFKIIRKLNSDVSMLCDIAKVSRGGYYKWLKSADLKEKDYEDYLCIKNIFDASKGKFGWRSIKMRLPDMNHKKIQRIMRKYDLKAKVRQKNPYKQTMKKRMDNCVFPNILDRKFDQPIPYKVFCTDITYIPFLKNFAYISVIKDIASGEIMSWNTSMSLDMSLVTETLKGVPPNLCLKALIHSDQGFHYTNQKYVNMVNELNMIQSMTGKGMCIDNAPIESFFGHMKD